MACGHYINNLEDQQFLPQVFKLPHFNINSTQKLSTDLKIFSLRHSDSHLCVTPHHLEEEPGSEEELGPDLQPDC